MPNWITINERYFIYKLQPNGTQDTVGITVTTKDNKTLERLAARTPEQLAAEFIGRIESKYGGGGKNISSEICQGQFSLLVINSCYCPIEDENVSREGFPDEFRERFSTKIPGRIRLKFI